MPAEIDIWRWLGFGTVVAVLIAIDLSIHRFRRGAGGDGRGDTQRAALIWTCIWIAAGLGFALYVWQAMGAELAQEYLAAYLIEKTLSVDNLFVFLVVFESLKIPRAQQRRVLWWGIIGALVFRLILILIGVSAIERWDWIEIVFGLLLIFTAYRVFRDDPADKKDSRVVQWLSRRLPVEEESSHDRFFVRRDGRWRATPLCIALLAVETTDLVFAVDSIPAAFSVTRSRFILYSSNVFAILGLRALYIVLAGALTRLEHLNVGLAVVLGFAGVKLILSRWVHLSPWWATGVVVVVLSTTVVTSLISRKKGRKADVHD